MAITSHPTDKKLLDALSAWVTSGFKAFIFWNKRWEKSGDSWENRGREIFYHSGFTENVWTLKRIWIWVGRMQCTWNGAAFIETSYFCYSPNSLLIQIQCQDQFGSLPKAQRRRAMESARSHSSQINNWRSKIDIIQLPDKLDTDISNAA